MNKDGVLIVPCKYDDASEYFSNVYVRVKNDGKWGVINKKGQLITECIYDEVEYFTEDGIAKVKKDGKYGFIDGNGKMVGVVNQQELF